MTDKQDSPEASVKKTSHFHWEWVAIIFCLLGIIGVGGAFGYFYLQLSQATFSSAKNVTHLQNTLTRTQNEIIVLQQAAQKSQALSQQQEQIIADWRAAQKGDLDKWHVAEAQYLVKLANDHLQFTHDVAMAKVLLERADQTLKDLQNPDLLAIRQSITSDLANVKAAPPVEVTELYLQLSALNNQIDQLTLPTTPLKANAASTQPATNLPWWKQELYQTWNALREMVIVRRNETNALPLVLPEEKTFLYQNLHAQIADAMWAVLHHNAAVYQASLTRATKWIQTYFVENDKLTQTMMQSLQTLQKMNIQVASINLSNTLQLFDNYFSSAKTTS